MLPGTRAGRKGGKRGTWGEVLGEGGGDGTIWLRTVVPPPTTLKPESALPSTWSQSGTTGRTPGCDWSPSEKSKMGDPPAKGYLFAVCSDSEWARKRIGIERQVVASTPTQRHSDQSSRSDVRTGSSRRASLEASSLRLEPLGLLVKEPNRQSFRSTEHRLGQVHQIPFAF